MLETPTGQDITATEAEDIRVYAGLLVTGVLESVFTLPMMRSVYTWSRDALAAVVAFCNWLMDQAPIYCNVTQVHMSALVRCESAAFLFTYP